MQRKITILGSTGSIGVNTLDLVRSRSDEFNVVGLSAGENFDLLIKQANEFKPEIIAISNEKFYSDLISGLNDKNIKVTSGSKGILDVASYPSDLTVIAIVGYAGLKPTIESIRHGKTIALANKECLVVAGTYINDCLKKYKTNLIPLDSEHNSIYQIFDFKNPEFVKDITLTASGGPFLNKDRKFLEQVTPAQAIKHPTWDMGKKISVDSATLMNKGLEIIESAHLFPVSIDQIKVIIHPESIIHSLVTFIDGSVHAQMGKPDMKIPISYALSWPHRHKLENSCLSLNDIKKLTFYSAEPENYPSIRLAYQAAKMGGITPAIFNAANEIAVDAFLHNQIKFTDITDIIEKVLNLDSKLSSNLSTLSIDLIEEADTWTRKTTSELIVNKNA